MQTSLEAAAAKLKTAQNAMAFTGAGASVESGIPTFRGRQGLWSKYDASTLEMSVFLANPSKSWALIHTIFYERWGHNEPNAGHRALARLEAAGHLTETVTQNVDGLHQAAGSKNVCEYHGTMTRLVCLGCGRRTPMTPERLASLPPLCEVCGAVLKPDFVFFGEGIPEAAAWRARTAAVNADVVLIIGSTGEVYPAAMVPETAAHRGATIIEVNPERSRFTESITDIFLQGKAGEVLPRLADLVLA